MDTPFLIIDGVIAAQTPKVIEPFREILPRFDTIIEIGYNRGGFSQWLLNNKPESTELYCFDITDQFREVQNSNIRFLVGDCFSDSTMGEITKLIKEGGRCLVLCDGGSKEKEFATYSRIIKPADVIMCHDYSHSYQTYAEVKASLNWPTAAESYRQNIQNAVIENNLEEYHYVEFYKVLWGAFIKVA